ncbi:hypothetical protein L7F22_044903 [Adiantum nelumboides]|nr:hypothetical protein [Adiantum nelumboides]
MTQREVERRRKKEEKRRSIKVRIISAQDLKKARLQFGRMRAYAVAYVADEEDSNSTMAARTRVDERGGQNPVWNDVITLSVREARLQEDSLACLTVDIYSLGGRLGLFRRADRLVGSARVFLSDIVKQQVGKEEGANPIQCLAFWVRLPSGEPHGILNIWIPPSGEFLRRHHALPPPNPFPVGSCPAPPAPDLHVPACRFFSPADRASDDVSYETEAFTFSWT